MVVVLSAVLVVGSWVQSSVIERDWLTPRSSTPEGSSVAHDVGSGTVRLVGGDAPDRPGRWLVEGRDGWLGVGEVISADTGGVVRAVTAAGGTLVDGEGVRFSRTVWPAEAPPGPVTETVIDGPASELGIGVMEGTDDTWVLLVHGNGQGPSEGYRLLPALRDAGYPTLLVTYRNDLGAPRSRGGHHGFGRDEWRDVDAALAFALEAGARDVVLVGYGSGGAIIGTLLAESTRAERVVAVVLDAPILSLGMAVDAAWAPQQVPGVVVGWAKAWAALRFGVDWDRLDHVSSPDPWNPPTLVIHGDHDGTAPLAASEAFARAYPEVVRLVVVAGAGHGLGWNLDPGAYELAVIDFLAAHAAGPSRFAPVG